MAWLLSNRRPSWRRRLSPQGLFVGLLLLLRRYPRLRPAIRPAQRLWLWLRLTSKFLTDIVVHFSSDGGTVLAGYIAFSGLLALFPFLIVLTITAGYLGQSEGASQAVQELFAVLPPEVGSVLRPAVNEVVTQPPTGLLGASVLGAIWAASSGLEALREGANRAYGVETPHAFWWNRLQSLWLVVLLAIVTPVAMIAIVAGPLIWSAITSFVDLPFRVQLIYTALRYLVGLLLLLAVTSALYQILPNVSLRKREIFPGAAFTVLAWLGTASLFSLYLSYAKSFSLTYGSLGGIVVTLVFFYVSAAIFVLGAEINAVRRRRRQRIERASRANS
ncbi:YihY/virulence factor BrkB family protein [Marinivivus vitaminiproducens]|uniref:YihY/virulence factor BrkB family protein n=1 Tax=Marinivivus vitaminiproducens TaxID=3035935 RepID=UPI0027A29185|nr:YihY/virulence factor BrkB family protein [Geminicoccaceae bacterium SCSIO 64248]